jgi:2,3-dihydroxybiphenyl 1,2-dioxygenase
LAYLGLEAADPGEWATFATEILGAQLGQPDPDGTQHVRFDEKEQRLAIHPGIDGSIAYIGWDVRNGTTLSAFIDVLKENRIQHQIGTGDECRHRRVHELVWFRDPAGWRVELCYGADVSAVPFRPARADLSGFIALGHVVAGVPDPQAATRFYVDVLGFKVTDYMDVKLPRYPEPLSLTFLRCDDGRNHSIALRKGERLEHVMVEVKDIDDVGRTLNLCRERNVPMRGTLGRHVNDLMISFYIKSPSGLHVEYGCGGSYVVDDNTWEIRHFTTASLWGHTEPVAPS